MHRKPISSHSGLDKVASLHVAKRKPVNLSLKAVERHLHRLHTDQNKARKAGNLAKVKVLTGLINQSTVGLARLEAIALNGGLLDSRARGNATLRPDQVKPYRAPFYHGRVIFSKDNNAL